jgi:hypothetical protein
MQLVNMQNRVAVSARGMQKRVLRVQRLTGARKSVRCFCV